MKQPLYRADEATASDDAAPAEPNQFALLAQRRFAPFFWTQFSGAANDNLFKFAFTVMVTYQLQVEWLPPAMAGLVIGALFILPFLLFSATSGQITDKFEKTRIIRFVKNLEVFIMAAGAWGFLRGDVVVLLACTFLMGLHSTLFGPVKFACLPQVLSERELTGGNGMVEMGTFVAILLGNIVGGLLIAIPDTGRLHVAVACIATAAAGRFSAQFIPAAPATDPGLRINWNPFSETWRNLRMAHGNPVVFRSLLGISWMWFFGAVFLSQFPSFARDVLHGNEQVASFLLAVFSLGIGTGSLLCEMLSRRHVEIGLVPLGAIGMSVFAVDLYFASRSLPPAELMDLRAFLSTPGHWRVLADLALLSLFAGLYSVPMYALIQLRAQPTHRARIIAANNILNALFMIASALIAGVLLQSGFSIPQIFLWVGLANAVVTLLVFILVPEYLLRFLAWMLSRLVCRFRLSGDEYIPLHGPAILAGNQASAIDAMLLIAASPRPVTFIMDRCLFDSLVAGAVLRLAKAIPDDPAAFGRAAQALRDGRLLAVFSLSPPKLDGGLPPSTDGVMKILDLARQEGLAPPVVPVAFTHPRSAFRPVALRIGPPLLAGQAEPRVLRERVAGLRGE